MAVRLKEARAFSAEELACLLPCPLEQFSIAEHVKSVRPDADDKNKTLLSDPLAREFVRAQYMYAKGFLRDITESIDREARSQNRCVPFFGNQGAPWGGSRMPVHSVVISDVVDAQCLEAFLLNPYHKAEPRPRAWRRRKEHRPGRQRSQPWPRPSVCIAPESSSTRRKWRKQPSKQHLLSIRQENKMTSINRPNRREFLSATAATASTWAGAKLTIASFLVLATCLGRVPAGEPRETVAAPPDRSISVATSVREPISDEDWRQVASRYGLVDTLFSPKAGGKDLTSENERVRWIKSLDPRLKVLVYGAAINAANCRLNVSKKKALEPDDWFLRDEAGRYVSHSKYPDNVNPDPGNPGWQEYVAGAFEDYIRRYGYDGVFVDLVGSTPYWVNTKTRKAVNPRTGSAYTDAEWKRANLDMVRTIREHIGDKLLIVNHGGRGKSYFRTAYADFFEFADGVCFEGSAGWYRTSLTNFGKESEWKADVDALVDCAKHGKMAIAFSAVKQRGSEEAPEVYEQHYRYIAASFLLGAGKEHYLRLTTRDILFWMEPDESCPALLETFRALCNLSLGDPRGAYYRDEGVYQRDFERGKVLVNPTGQNVKLQLQGTWRTDKGQPVESLLLMPGHTGTILYRRK